MAVLGILEGFAPALRRKTNTFGSGDTYASSRSRRGIGPALLGANPEDSDPELRSWIDNAYQNVAAEWGRKEIEQVTATGQTFTPAQKAAKAEAMAQARLMAIANYRASKGLPYEPNIPATTAQLSTSASRSAGIGRAAESQYNAAKNAALSAGLSSAQAEAIGQQAAASVVSNTAFSVADAIATAKAVASKPQAAPNPPPPVIPSASTPVQDALRHIHANLAPQDITEQIPSGAASAPPAPSPQEILRSTQADAGEVEEKPAAKSFLVPIAALAAAYFFLKG